MFCDLVDFTALSVRLDPEEVQDVIRAYHACVADTIARFGGFVARYVGDGVLIYFGWPASGEADAERAVLAALALVAGIDEISVHDEKLRARVGIASGLVVVGDFDRQGLCARKNGFRRSAKSRFSFARHRRPRWHSDQLQH